ncbi:MAG TPA: aminodeoxychorismate synthase component I [Steroidobacteraceae bacterium]|nr:aminodeoxychorismate synthase component I [Steroidobacteraceae bacterium]
MSPFVERSVEAAPERLFDLHCRFPERYPALLESVARSDTLGRFDLLFAHPGSAIVKSHDGQVSAGEGPDESFLTRFDAAFGRERIGPIDSSLPFTGGWLMLLAYELAGEIEPTLRLPRTRDRTPQAIALRVPAALIFDHGSHRLHLLAERGYEHLLDAMAADLATCPPAPAARSVKLLELHEDPPGDFLAAVLRVKEHIAAGDVYQVNLSRAWRARVAGAPGADAVADLYRALRQANPAPFAASLRSHGHTVLSSSPERLFSVRGGEIATRPIAGTRPRSRVPGADAGEKESLVRHPKERAEHVMLIDLERNDLGRLCRPGTVHVDEFMVLETYEHVHHIVSSVRGSLERAVTPGRILRAVFPGGTITGCPKVRCMQIIAALEKEGRGAYTGSLGYLNRDGSGDFNILIRSLSVVGDAVTLRAGAGIVADSDPTRELAETRAKARGLLRALGGDA